MPVNRNALIRFKTIDKCLQNRFRRWTLLDLIDACSETLYEYEGIDKGVSKRSVQGDIQMMRSDKLGYNAPIIVLDKKYYTYEDPNYSITNIPLTNQDLDKLTEAVEFMKQFQGFSHFKNLDGMVQKLEDHIYSQKTQNRPAIDFEKNNNLRGLEYLDPLHRAIINKQALTMVYKSFQARHANEFLFHPQLLKEFRNRWFIIGFIENNPNIMNLALDRIRGLEISKKVYLEKGEINFQDYFKHVIGVSVNPNQEREKIMLFVNHKHAPYILTKPLHPSQEEVSRNNFGVLISLNIQHNFELEKEILSFGEAIKVIAPKLLRKRLKDRLKEASDNYESDLGVAQLNTIKKRLIRKGTIEINPVYSKREVRKIGALIQQYFKKENLNTANQREIFSKIPGLKSLLLNSNLTTILDFLMPKAFLVKSVYFEKNRDADWFVAWHQDLPINVNEKVETEGFSTWTFRDNLHSVIPPLEISQNILAIRIHLDDTTVANGALEVIPGSHRKRHSPEEIQTITENSFSEHCEINSGGIQVLRPLLLYRSAKTKNHKKRRVIHLEFSAEELPGKLEWREKEMLEIKL